MSQNLTARLDHFITQVKSFLWYERSSLASRFWDTLPVERPDLKHLLYDQLLHEYLPSQVKSTSFSKSRAPVWENIFGQYPRHLPIQSSYADVVTVEGNEEGVDNVEHQEEAVHPPAKKWAGKWSSLNVQ